MTRSVTCVDANGAAAADPAAACKGLAAPAATAACNSAPCLGYTWQVDHSGLSFGAASACRWCQSVQWHLIAL